MKLTKLLPIVALSGMATIAMPLVSCATKGGDTPEPAQKTMTLKTTEGELPEFINVGDTIKLLAYDEGGKLIDGAKFATIDEEHISVLANGTVYGKMAGVATVTCSAKGYKQAIWICNVHDSDDYIDIDYKETIMGDVPVLSTGEALMTMSLDSTYKLRLYWNEATKIVTQPTKWSIWCANFDTSKIAEALDTSMVAKINGEGDIPKSKYNTDDCIFSPNEDLGLNNESVLTFEFQLNGDSFPGEFQGKFYLMGDA